MILFFIFFPTHQPVEKAKAHTNSAMIALSMPRYAAPPAAAATPIVQRGQWARSLRACAATNISAAKAQRAFMFKSLKWFTVQENHDGCMTYSMTTVKATKAPSITLRWCRSYQAVNDIPASPPQLSSLYSHQKGYHASLSSSSNA